MVNCQLLLRIFILVNSAINIRTTWRRKFPQLGNARFYLNQTGSVVHADDHKHGERLDNRDRENILITLPMTQSGNSKQLCGDQGKENAQNGCGDNADQNSL